MGITSRGFRLGLGVCALLGALSVSAGSSDPFIVTFDQVGGTTGTTLRVSVTIPPHHHLYADQVQAELEDGTPLPLAGGDKPVRVYDSFSDSIRDSFTNTFSLLYRSGSVLPSGTLVTFSYQGCSDTQCFFPKRQSYRIVPGEGAAPIRSLPEIAASNDSIGQGWDVTAKSHRVSARAAGYLNTSDFLSFMDRAEGRERPGTELKGSMALRVKAGFLNFTDNPAAFLKRYGVWWTALLILIGGVLLNLTPCVLPMIPVNLAILGVGARTSSRGRGFLLGLAYGTGIACVYGGLGLVVVLTGTQFGALNSLPGFNAVIGVIFVLLALAMFDVIAIDLSKFQSGAPSGTGRERGGLIAATVMGGISALLAGACVAPVVIAVLLLSGSLYSQGVEVGLALPFLLGVGMALPWPLAAAGLAFLPRPGVWMTWVKSLFGIFIVLMALYYFSLAYRGWAGAPSAHLSRSGRDEITVTDVEKWTTILRESERDGRPVFVDFWATWCKNCEAMERTTFRDPPVEARLSGYRVVKFQVENLTSRPARAVTDYFEIKGLPTYLILSPGKR